MHELVVRARQLASVAQLVIALHRNRSAIGSSQRVYIVAFFAFTIEIFVLLYELQTRNAKRFINFYNLFFNFSNLFFLLDVH